MPFDIRLATINDVLEIAALESAAMDAPWSLAQIHTALDGEEGLRYQCYVLRVQAQIVAYALLWLGVDDVELLRMVVSTDHRRQGLASALLEWVVRASTSTHRSRLLLEVAASNQVAQQFYADVGFQSLGRRKAYYPHPHQDAEDALVLYMAL